MSADNDPEKVDLVRAAAQMMATAGDNAEPRARLRADRLANAGAADAAALWRRIAAEIRSRSVMQATPALDGRQAAAATAPAASRDDPP